MSEVYLDKSYWVGLIKMSLSRLFILRVLYEEPLHGYEISKRIDVITKGCCAPTEGALYPVLREFAEGGYLSCQTQVVEGRQRKVYSITKKGERAYRVSLEAWQESAKALIKAKKSLQLEEGHKLVNTPSGKNFKGTMHGSPDYLRKLRKENDDR